MRIRLIPEIKNRRPRMTNMIDGLISLVELTNSTAARISPAIPRTVNKAPKILFKFIIKYF